MYKRQRYSREVRLAIQNILVEALGGTDVVFETQFSESILARIHYVIRIPVGLEPSYDIDELESRVVEVATTWQDGLRKALFSQIEEALAARYLQDYAHSFPGGYREDCHPRIAVDDIERIERIRGSGHLALHLYHPIVESGDQMHVRLYSPARPVPLSEVIPVLENMGLSVFGERPYRIRHAAGDVWIHDFATRHAMSSSQVSVAARRLFVETFLLAWDGVIDNDGFNGLVLRAELAWNEALLFRAYSRYLHQIKVPYTQAYTIGVLNRNPEVVRVLNRLFQRRFDPDCQTDSAQEEQQLAQFEVLLEAVSSLDDDRILRSFLNLIQATLRTNFYRREDDGSLKPYLSFKIDPSRVNGMPLPFPMFEIFVFSAQM